MTLTDMLKAKAADAISAQLTGQKPQRPGKDQHATPSGPTPWPPTSSSQPHHQSYDPSHSYGPSQGRPNSYHGPSNDYRNTGYPGQYSNAPYGAQDDSHLGVPYHPSPPPGQPPHSSNNYRAQLESFLNGSKSSASGSNANGKIDYAGMAQQFLLGKNQKDKKDPWGLGGGGWSGMGGGGSSGMGLGESSHGGKHAHKSDPWGLGSKENWLGTKKDWGLESGKKAKKGHKAHKDLEELQEAQDAMDAADIAQRIKDDGGEIDEDTAEAILEALLG